MCVTIVTLIACLVEVLPLIVFHGGVRGEFVESFLCCVPCTILTTVAFPTMFSSAKDI